MGFCHTLCLCFGFVVFFDASDSACGSIRKQHVALALCSALTLCDYINMAGLSANALCGSMSREVGHMWSTT